MGVLVLLVRRGLKETQAPPGPEDHREYRAYREHEAQQDPWAIQDLWASGVLRVSRESKETPVLLALLVARKGRPVLLAPLVLTDREGHKVCRACREHEAHQVLEDQPVLMALVVSEGSQDQQAPGVALVLEVLLALRDHKVTPVLLAPQGHLAQPR